MRRTAKSRNRHRCLAAIGALAIVALLVAIAPGATALVPWEGTPGPNQGIGVAGESAEAQTNEAGDDRSPTDEPTDAPTPTDALTDAPTAAAREPSTRVPPEAPAAATTSDANARMPRQQVELQRGPSPTLSVVPMQSPVDFRIGSVIAFTVAIENPTGGGARNSVVVTNSLPANAGLDWSSEAPAKVNCLQGTTTITCDFGDIADGGSASAVIKATVESGATCGIVSTTAWMTIEGGAPTTAAGSVVVRGCPPSITARINTGARPTANLPFSVEADFQPIDGLNDVSGAASISVCGPTTSPVACTSGGTLVGDSFTIFANTITSDGFTPPRTGTYCTRTDYVPDAGSDYAPTSHAGTTAAECVTVIPASSLTLTLLTPSTVAFGNVATGDVKLATNAVQIRVESTGGGWSAGSCAVSNDHGETLSASDLDWRLSGSTDWTTFDTAGTGSGCIPASASGPQTYTYDYQLTVPANSAAGPFDLTIVYTVEG